LEKILSNFLSQYITNRADFKGLRGELGSTRRHPNKWLETATCYFDRLGVVHDG